ncbi:hypothetical protein [Cohnella mopanensis]|uniref:hypothetical protein n=1 Tax=Cohnella mopanensis TaxID=2911966 RepID=UPI001EF98E41|nr:hypothetical protein [Cohnella mopanensis]
MEMQSLQAKFDTQDQAESVIRKLASLRGDRFRLERASSAGAVSSAPEFSQTTALDSRLEASEELTPAQTSSNAEFTLSAIVPGDASDQARTVILQAGGEII